MFAKTRRMARKVKLVEKLKDSVRIAVDLPVGIEGGYFVGAGGFAGQEHDKTIVDYNIEPAGQPGLWCQWVPTEDGEGICWDGGEKFYEHVKWLEYLIIHFLKPWGYVLSGSVRWQGEDGDDRGTITVKDNVVSSHRAKTVW